MALVVFFQEDPKCVSLILRFFVKRLPGIEINESDRVLCETNETVYAVRSCERHLVCGGGGSVLSFTHSVLQTFDVACVFCQHLLSLKNIHKDISILYKLILTK